MLDRSLTRLFAALGGLALAAVSFGVGFQLGNSASSSDPGGPDGFRILGEVRNKIGQSAAGPFDEKRLVQGAVRGMLEATGDTYAEYLDPETYRSFQDISTGHFSGVGLWLKDEEAIRVVAVLDGTPAARAGIRNGDLIRAVGDRKVEGLSLEQVVQRIKGRPGTKVRLSVERDGLGLDFTLVREEIQVPAVESRLLEDRVGLVKLITFSGGAGDRVREAVKQMSSRGARGFILDLRGNPGGLLEEAVNVAGVFLDGGRVVSYRERGREEVHRDVRGAPETKLPLVVLVDEGSASASEIVAGAIQDRRRGILVGTATYGKGSVQTVFPLSGGSAVKLTTSSYFTPAGRAIGKGGIAPDVQADGKEVQLARALEILAELLAAGEAQAAA